MGNPQPGCIFIQVLRPSNFEPDIFLSTCAGALQDDGLPVRRARIRIPDDQMVVSHRTIDPVLGNRLHAFLTERPLSHVILNSTLYPDIIEAIRDAIPGAAVLCLGRDFPVFLPRLIHDFVSGVSRPPANPTVAPPHWALHGDELTEFYELVHTSRPKLMLEVTDLTPEVPRRGMEGDIFIDQLCYYRAPYRGDEPALAGASSCTFCAIPQATRRPSPPDLEVALAQIEAYLAVDPNARVFHVMDYGILGHLVELAKVISHASVSGLELCSSVRAPDILAHRADIEAALPILAASGHRFHVFNIGFETFSEAEFERLNKGYPVLQNVGCIRYLTELEERFPASFVFSRWGAHGFIGTTCWSSLRDLRINAFFGQALGFARLSNRFFLRKLRLYPQLPLFEVARRDGLLSEEYADWRLNNATWTGYAAETPYRFLDPETERAYRWTVRLLLPETPQEHEWNGILRAELAGIEADDWELVAYAAILHAVRQTGADGGLSDEEFVEAIKHATGLPTPDLFPSTDLSDDASAFSPEPLPTSVVLGAREREMLVRGVKPTIKLESLQRPEADALAADLSRQGFHATVLSERQPINLFRDGDNGSVASEPADRCTLIAGRRATDVEALSTIILDTDLAYPDQARRAGKLLGYPECCVAAYAALPPRVRHVDMHLLAASVARTTGLIHPELDFYAPGSMTEFFPCAMDCAAALDRARRLPDRESPPLPGAVLMLSPLSRIELYEVADAPCGWRYGEARLRGAWAWGDRIFEQLRRGDRLEVLERLLLIYRDWDLVAAIPHDVIVPMAYGAVNRFPWLANITRRVTPRTKATDLQSVAARTPLAPQRFGLPNLMPDLLAGRAVADVRINAESILVELDESLGALTLELRFARPADRCYLRGGCFAVSYRLAPGEEFSPGVDTACRDLLRWAESHRQVVEQVMMTAIPTTSSL